MIAKMTPPSETLPRTRRLQEPQSDLLESPRRPSPSEMAYALKDCHNAALRQYGSDSGGFHAFDPTTMTTAGVYDGKGGFPHGTVVSNLAWGRISEWFAQRLLEYDAVTRPWVIVEQIGDVSFRVPDHEYETETDAVIALIELDDRYSGEDRELFVDGPGLNNPIGVGRQRPNTD